MSGPVKSHASTNNSAIIHNVDEKSDISVTEEELLKKENITPEDVLKLNRLTNCNLFNFNTVFCQKLIFVMSRIFHFHI